MCPSSDCWEYDEANKKCTLQSDCVKLDCGPTKITMSVKPGVFAEATSTVIDSVIDDDGYYNVECALGTTCETHAFSTDGSM